MEPWQPGGGGRGGRVDSHDGPGRTAVLLMSRSGTSLRDPPKYLLLHYANEDKPIQLSNPCSFDFICTPRPGRPGEILVTRVKPIIDISYEVPNAP